MKSLKEILRSLEGLSDIELFVIDLFVAPWLIRRCGRSTIGWK